MEANLLRVIESDTNLEVRGSFALSPLRQAGEEPMRVEGVQKRTSTSARRLERNNPSGMGENVDIWI